VCRPFYEHAAGPSDRAMALRRSPRNPCLNGLHDCCALDNCVMSREFSVKGSPRARSFSSGRGQAPWETDPAAVVVVVAAEVAAEAERQATWVARAAAVAAAARVLAVRPCRADIRTGADTPRVCKRWKNINVSLFVCLLPGHGIKTTKTLVSLPLPHHGADTRGATNPRC
jgi:hypothetical protein